MQIRPDAPVIFGGRGRRVGWGFTYYGLLAGVLLRKEFGIVGFGVVREGREGLEVAGVFNFVEDCRLED